MRLHEVGDVTTADTEVNQADEVGYENDRKYDIKYALPAFVTPRLIFLCPERGVESLILGVCECSDCSRVIPVFNIVGSAFLLFLQLSCVARHSRRNTLKTCLPTKMR